MQRPVGCAVLFVTSALLVGCGNMPTFFQNSPGDVAKAFYAAANEGRYSEAEQMLSEDAKNFIKGTLGQMVGGIKGICDQNTRDGTIARVDIQKEEVRGEGATVIAKISFRDGSSKDDDKTSLIREKGSWRITLGP